MSTPGAVVRRILFYVFLTVVAAFFALPLLWLVFAPFDAHPGLTVKLPDFTLDNFRRLGENPYAVPSLRNSILISGGTMLLVTALSALAAYALSRVRLPGRDPLLYGLLLLSSIVTGTAAMVPIFLLMFQLGLIDARSGVVLVLTGGLLPAAIFILKDFMDATPRSYEESARVFGASPLQIAAPRGAADSAPGAGDHRGLGAGQRLGQLPECLHPAARPGQVAGRGRHVHVLHRGRPGQPALSSPPSHCSTRCPSWRCTSSSTAATASASMEGSSADGRHRHSSD